MGAYTYKLNIEYTPGFKCDVFTPVGTSSRAAVMLTHGGGWHLGDKTEQAGSAKILASNGYTAVTVNYPLTWDASEWPKQLDVLAAGWAFTGNQPYVDSDRLMALGTSAGGHLSLMTRWAGWNPKCIGAWSPCTDMPWLATQTQDPGWQQFSDGFDALFGAGTWDANDPRLHDASPINVIADVPVFLARGTGEFLPAEQGDVMDAYLTQIGTPHLYKVYPVALHGVKLRPYAMPDMVPWMASVL